MEASSVQRWTSVTVVLFLLALGVSGCARIGGTPEGPEVWEDGPTSRPYKVFGVTYYPMKNANGYVEEGTASWYGKKFHGRPTAIGETYDMYGMTAAHTILPLPSRVRVTNLANGRSVELRVNDRGPFVKNRLIDLSLTAARQLGFAKQGTARVRVEALGPDRKLTSQEKARSKAKITAQTRTKTQGATSPAKPTPKKRNARQTESTSHSGQGFYVQVGSFQAASNAWRLAETLEEVGDARVVKKWVNGEKFYRVRFGPFATADQAERIVSRLDQNGFGAGSIVKE
ncbi:MAG: septal ring lytic transglycosylase RlpA family protein [Magnetococcales bacterium]|nr:septal ring lytic transglycosylase RlpA family protein [Magnetococcales bacterium]